MSGSYAEAHAHAHAPTRRLNLALCSLEVPTHARHTTPVIDRELLRELMLEVVAEGVRDGVDVSVPDAVVEGEGPDVTLTVAVGEPEGDGDGSTVTLTARSKAASPLVPLSWCTCQHHTDQRPRVARECVQHARTT